MKLSGLRRRVGSVLKSTRATETPVARSAAIEQLETRCLLSAYSSAVLADAPRGYFQLDEAGTAQFAQNHPNATGGNSLVGQYFNRPDLGQPGIPGTAGDTAAQFNISGLNQDVHNIVDSKNYTGVTVEAWVRPTQTNNQGIVVNTDSSGVYVDWTYNLRIVNIDGHAHFAFYAFDGAAKMFVSNQDVVAGNLYHLAATVKNGRAIGLYINGAKSGGTYYSNGVAQVGPVPVGTLVNYKTWLIASVVGGNGLDPYALDFFHGTIDEVAWYPVRLSDAQIANHYSVGSAAIPAGSIQGTLFEDVNGNGSGGTGEGPLVNWTVFLDTNRNGRLDTGELQTATDNGGRYKFSGLVPGGYRVQEIIPSGWVGVTPRFGSADVSVSANVTSIQDFAAARPIVISGSLYQDVNHDGIRQANDTGIQGDTVFLDINDNGVIDAGDFTTTTDANGGYTFAQLPPRTYTLRIVTQPPFTIPTSPRTLVLTLVSGQVMMNVNVGLRTP